MFPERSERVLQTSASLGRVLTEISWNALAATSHEKSTASSYAKEAEVLLRAVSKHRKAMADKDSWRTYDLQGRLGDAIAVGALVELDLPDGVRRSKLAEAEQLLLRGHDGLRKAATVDKEYVRELFIG